MPFLAAIPAWVGVAAAIGGAAVAAGGQIISGIQAKKQAEAQQAAYDYQAQVAQQQATYAERKANLEAKRRKLEGMRLISTQIAKYGSAGIALAGTPLEVMADTAKEIEYDIQLIKYGGEVEKRQYLGQAGYYTGTGIQTAAAGQQAMLGGFMKAGAGLLTSAANIYSQHGPRGGNSPLASSSNAYQGPMIHHRY